MSNGYRRRKGVECMSAWDKQIGGDHYKKYAIQPTEYAEKNGLTF